MSGSSTGIPLRPGNDTRVKSESNMDEYMDGQLEGTPEASIEGGSRSDPEESEESRKLRKKREYNRIAQREFRRRRKDRMTKLEEAQVIAVNDQGMEIFQLRKQNGELRVQIETLKSFIYANGMNYNESMPLPPVVPSASAPRHSSIGSSASSIFESMTSDGSMMDALGSSNMLPANQLAMTSAMLPSAMQAFAGAAPSSSNMQGMQYSMAHPAGSRGSPQDMAGSIDFSAVASRTTPFQGMPFTISSMSSTSQVTAHMPLPSHASSSRSASAEQSNVIALMPASRMKTSNAICALFSQLFAEAQTFPPPTSNQPCPRHLQILAALGPSLPTHFRPTATQLSTPHYFGVDLLPSPALRDRLCIAGPEVSVSFLYEFDYLLLSPNMDENQRLTIWGDDAYSEVGWEFSGDMLARWGWLVGPAWAERANFWRRQRGLHPLPMPVEAPEGSLWGMWQQLRLGVLGGDSMVSSTVVGMAGLGLQPGNQQHMQ